MNIEYAETARMSQTGSALLRAIQNNSMPVLDLFVRESIQNSLDAADARKKYVKVDFNIGTFHSDKLALQLEGITEKLKNIYKDQQMFISIRDSNTVGLTGPIKYDDVKDNEYGNLIKLIYEISKPQSKEGAGGSWGLGKTVYFRVGIGLVIYYSRIKLNNGHYESRLAGCLVEDEKRKDALLKRHGKNIERGIAWWGDKKIFSKNETVPITDEKKINNLISIFGIKPYIGDDTGTTIIIPYISEDKILRELIPSELSPTSIKPFWINSIESYLKIATQKWYHPRINNKEYKYGKYIEVFVNDIHITYDEFYPCFKIMQDLYNCASIQKPCLKSLPKIEVKTKNIGLRNIFSDGQIAGTLAHVEVSESDLKMLPPHNLPSPYDFVNLKNEDSSNNPLIMSYTRKTGMVVSYEIMGHWTDNVPRSSKEKYIFSYFVLNSANRLKITDNLISLEEYIRQGELADHTCWGDWTLNSGNPNIVSKIQSQVRKALAKSYKQEDDTTVAVEDKGMGREFAKFLLPPSGYGKGSSNPSNERRSPTKKKSDKCTLDISSRPVFKDGALIFDITLDIPKYRSPIDISMKAITEKMGLKADDWEKEESIGSEFPVDIKKLTIDKLKINKETVLFDHLRTYKNHLSINYIETERYKKKYGVRVTYDSKENDPNHLVITGKLICASTDPQLRVGVDIEEVAIDG